MDNKEIATYYRKRRKDKGEEVREYERMKKREYYAKNPEKHREMSNKYYRENREKALAASRIYRDNLKITALKIYGGDPPQCECCGEKVIEFLTLDHKDKNGSQHRKEMKSKIYTWLKRNDYPKDLNLRVLCYNCNMARGHFGYCPHKEGSKYGSN